MEELFRSLMPWGTEVIVWAQAHSAPWLDTIFKFFTTLGYTEFYVFVLPVVFWCLDKRLGVALAYLSMLSAWANDVVKYIFSIPRPADPRIRVPLPETSPSFPSGHAQNAVSVWSYLAYRVRKPLFTTLALVVILGISLSRIVLGVHFPEDVLGGWLIGLVLLALYIPLAPPIGRWIERQTMAVQLGAAIVVPLALIFVHPADTQGLYPAEGAITPMSALTGLGIGLVMERAWVRFRVEGAWWRRAVRFVAGMMVVAIFYLGPKLLLPEGMAYGVEAAIRLVRYLLLGWVVAFLCPWLFVKLHLAERQDEPLPMA
jgi:membrane-associated phospholipid phosphatase